MKWIVALAIGLALAFSPGAALAAPGDEDDDFLLRVGADVVIAEGETVGNVVVIDGNLTVNGTVTDTVFVIDGDATVSGSVGNDLTVISGTINLQAGSTVKNVTSVRGDFNRAQTATVTGDVDEQDNFQFFQGVVAIFSFLFWLAMSVAIIVAGLVFAAIGGRQLTAAAQTMTGDIVASLIGAIAVWVALPIMAVLAIVTLIGLPLGLGVLLFLLPALGFLGYIVAGARLGMAIAKASGRESGTHPYLAVTVGLILLQLAILVPVIGGLVAFLAGIWGAGALAVTAYRGAGGRGLPTARTTLGIEPQPAA